MLRDFYYRKIDSHRSLPSRKQNGNNSSRTEIYATPCNLPPIPSGGRGLGRGWLYELHEFDFSPNHKATPILTFPRRTGEGTRLLIQQRGRLKITIYGISDDLVYHQTTPNTSPPSFPRRRESIGGIRFIWMALKIFVARFLLLDFCYSKLDSCRNLSS